METQIHNIKPLFDKNSVILILGSFPSVISRKEGFYYANGKNRFYDVLTNVFKWDKVPSTIEEKKSYLLGSGIALWDVISSCEIIGSSDESIKSVIPNDLNIILKKCKIETIFCNGNKAFTLYNKYLKDVLGINAVLLPSSSSANATYSLDKLINIWNEIISKNVFMKRYFTFDSKDYNSLDEILIRPSVRAIIKKGEFYALVHSLRYDYYKFPGGGIEEGESHIDALIREVKEEAGLNVIISSIKPFGSALRISKYLKDFKQVVLYQNNYYYLCEVSDEVNDQKLDDYEDYEHFTLEYIKPKIACEVNKLPDHGPKSKEMILREAKILEML